MRTKFTPEDFIAKFEKIPDWQWTTGHFRQTKINPNDPAEVGVACCALGHCGMTNGKAVGKAVINEAGALDNLFSQTKVPIRVTSINDAVDSYFSLTLTSGLWFNDLGDTPKERVINALVLVATGLWEAAVPESRKILV